MSEQARTIQELFEIRMTLIGEISRLNAQHLQVTQQLSGNEFEIMRCQDGLREQAANDQLRSDLADAVARDEHLKNRIDEFIEQLQVLEDEVAALDRELTDL